MSFILGIIVILICIGSTISLFLTAFAIYEVSDYSNIPKYFHKRGSFISTWSVLCLYAILIFGFEKALFFIPSSWGFHSGDDGYWIEIRAIAALILALMFSSIAVKAYKYLMKTEKILNDNEETISILTEENIGYRSSDLFGYFSSRKKILSNKNKYRLAEIIEDSASKILNTNDEWQEGNLDDEAYILEVNKQTIKLIESCKIIASFLPPPRILPLS